MFDIHTIYVFFLFVHIKYILIAYECVRRYIPCDVLVVRFFQKFVHLLMISSEYVFSMYNTKFLVYSSKCEAQKAPSAQNLRVQTNSPEAT